MLLSPTFRDPSLSAAIGSPEDEVVVRPSQRVNTLLVVEVEAEWSTAGTSSIMELVASVVVDGVVVIKVDQVKINLTFL